MTPTGDLTLRHTSIHIQYVFWFTYVAPTVLSFKNCGVNWYRTNLPAWGSISSISVSDSLSSEGKKMQNCGYLKTKTNTCTGSLSEVGGWGLGVCVCLHAHMLMFVLVSIALLVFQNYVTNFFPLDQRILDQGHDIPPGHKQPVPNICFF